MTGVAGRSGRPKADKKTPKGDGVPQSPRTLSASAKKHFDWLMERLDTAADGSPWRRIDGATLASLAELMEAEERLSKLLDGGKFDERLQRLKMQHADRVFKFSSIVGLTPRDRERLPQPSTTAGDDADEWN